MLFRVVCTARLRAECNSIDFLGKAAYRGTKPPRAEVTWPRGYCNSVADLGPTPHFPPVSWNQTGFEFEFYLCEFQLPYLQNGGNNIFHTELLWSSVHVCWATSANLVSFTSPQPRLFVESISFIDVCMLIEVCNGPFQVMYILYGKLPQGPYIAAESENGCDDQSLNVRVEKRGPKISTLRIQRQPKFRRSLTPWDRVWRWQGLEVLICFPSTQHAAAGMCWWNWTGPESAGSDVAWAPHPLPENHPTVPRASR